MEKNFLHVNDLNKAEFEELIDLSHWIKSKLKQNNYSPMRNKTLAMIFQKPSARTRISFETGFYRLGGHALYLGPDDIGTETHNDHMVLLVETGLLSYAIFILIILFVSPKMSRLSEWPIITYSQSSFIISGDISPVNAPFFSWYTFWAPTLILFLFVNSATLLNEVKGGHKITSTFTVDSRFSSIARTNCSAASTVLFIFQFPAITRLLMLASSMIYAPNLSNFPECASARAIRSVA